MLTYDAHGATQQQSAAISPLSEHSLIGSRDVPPHYPPLRSEIDAVGGRETFMKAGLADIASMMQKIYAEQSPELCKALQSAA